ncbi:hypothetical protein GCK72_026178 [Caenorhabditis remanei]|uniref:Uncharacterized protein n=1 Tax=Caenorhabditis remanei TaxID=31234 RepID=A0A6A5G447_CAERE|nr:hypothetical protein GCK72_026178 [Caenorhabditis remanei]KAF1749710.1 hypothetical protein GCK72_026178 [Caenorhabditis remanei]
MNFGYNDGGIPDEKFVVTEELTLEEAASKKKLPPPQVYLEKIYPIGFIFKEKEVLCMKCGKQFKCPTTETKVVYDCHARAA